MIAGLAHAFGCSMADVRAMTYRDIDAMARVLIEEQQELARQQELAKRKGARR